MPWPSPNFRAHHPQQETRLRNTTAERGPAASLLSRVPRPGSSRKHHPYPKSIYGTRRSPLVGGQEGNGPIGGDSRTASPRQAELNEAASGGVTMPRTEGAHGPTLPTRPRGAAGDREMGASTRDSRPTRAGSLNLTGTLNERQPERAPRARAGAAPPTTHAGENAWTRTEGGGSWGGIGGAAPPPREPRKETRTPLTRGRGMLKSATTNS